MARGAQAGKALIGEHIRAVFARIAATTIVAALCASCLRAQSVERNRITLTATTRAYSVGDSSVSERVANARYEVFASRLRFRLDGAVLRYSSSAENISGNLPIAGRIDFSFRPGDTVAVFARSASRPLDLTTRQTAALATAGTSTVDLESGGLGAPALGGTRVTFAFPLGDQVLAIRAGGEIEPRPSGTQPVYWRGTTVRGGLTLTAGSGDRRLSASIDATRSSADSLGGRNLFPGGGSLSLQVAADLSVLDPFDPLEDQRWPIRTVAFYGRPFGSERPDQPNLIIPHGDLFGAIGTMLMPVGALTIAPTLQYLRESSQSESSTALLRSVISGHAWTAQAGLDLTIPLGSALEITPQAGYTFGSVGATLAQGATLRRGRVVRSSSFSDGIRGRWFSIQLAATF